MTLEQRRVKRLNVSNVDLDAWIITECVSYQNLEE